MYDWAGEHFAAYSLDTRPLEGVTWDLLVWLLERGLALPGE